MENVEAEGTACHHYDRGSYVVASCRRSGGSAWRASGHRVLPVITTTVSRASRHPGGGWQRMESTKAVGTACHHYDRGSYIEVLRRLAGGSSWRASSQRVRTSLRQLSRPVRILKHRAAGRAASPPVRHGESIGAIVIYVFFKTLCRTSCHRATGRVGTHGKY